jgi:arsenite methyltransferase
MTAESVFDATAARKLEAAYLTPDTVEQRHATLQALRLRPGERVLDVGSGPGLLAAEMAQVVGPAGHVTALDVSDAMLALSRRRCADLDGVGRVGLVKADAAALPFGDAIFDAATSVQVYEYVADLPSALAELHRVLRPGGRVLILDTDWDSIVWRTGDEARMARVLAAWDEHLVHRDLPRRLPQLLAEAGLALERCAVVPILNVGYERETYSGGMIELMAAFVAERRGVSADEAEAWAAELRGLGRDYFFSINRYLFLARR